MDMEMKTINKDMGAQDVEMDEQGNSEEYDIHGLERMSSGRIKFDVPDAQESNAAPSRGNSLRKSSSIQARSRGLSTFASAHSTKFVTETTETLDKWMIDNCVRQQSETFYLPGLLSSDDITEKNFYSRTGCQIYKFKKAQIPYSVHFLSEWSLLWNTLILDESDYVRTGCPLLYYCVAFFFNSKIMAVTLTLGIYYTIILTVSYSHKGWKSAPTGSTALTIAAMCICVIMGAMAIKGSVFGPLLVKRRKSADAIERDRQASTEAFGGKTPFHQNTLRDSEGITDEDVNKAAADRESEPHFAMSNHSSGPVSDVEAQIRRVETDKRLYKDDTLWNSAKNIAGLFSMMHFKTFRPQKHTRKQKKSGLMEVSGFFDLIESGTKYLNTIGYEKHPFTPRIYTTYFLQFALAFSTIFVLTNFVIHWSKIQHNGCTINSKMNDDTPKKDDDIECGRYNYQIIMYGGFVISAAAMWMLMMTLGTLIATLIYGADVAHGLTTYWLLRFMPLRRVKHDFIDDATPGGESFGSNLQALIQRDAYERYLFTYQYMQSATKIWGSLLMFILVLCICLFVYSYYVTLLLYTQKSKVSGSTISICFGSMTAFVFIVNLVAYANGAVDKILDGFLYSATDDYSLLGGRESWINFVRQSPMFWRIFGFAITFEFIGRFLAGSATTVIGGFLVVVSN